MLGLGLAWLGIDVLGAWLADALGTGGGRGLEYFDPEALALNWRVLAFAAVLTGSVGIGCGLFPAWQAARTNPNDAFKGTTSTAGIQRRVNSALGRNGLMIVQVAVAMVLLAGASLMMRSLANLERVETGYDPDRLLTAMYSLSPADEQAGVDPGVFHVDYVNRLRALPGVVAATLVRYRWAVRPGAQSFSGPRDAPA